MTGKKGQFYLLAAIIIITLIVGFVTIQNYSSRKSSVKLYDLKDELGIESQNVIDYGTANEENLNSLLEQFVESYANYAGDNKNLYFIFGDADDLQVKAYEDLSDVSSNFIATEEGGKISIVIGEVTYQFDLLAKENFYFIVSQEIEGETHIVTG